LVFAGDADGADKQARRPFLAGEDVSDCRTHRRFAGIGAGGAARHTLLAELIDPNNTAGDVWADTAYRSKPNEKFLSPHPRPPARTPIHRITDCLKPPGYWRSPTNPRQMPISSLRRGDMTPLRKPGWNPMWDAVAASGLSAHKPDYHMEKRAGG
jgi:hypothetical protein